MGAKTSISWTQTVHADGTVTAGSTWNPLRALVKPNAVQIAQDKGYKSLFNILTGVKTTGEPRVIPGKTWGYGCEIHSPGCVNCYACTLNGRTLPAWGTGLPYNRESRDLLDYYLDEKELRRPLHWQRPRKIFPTSMSDWFGEFVPDTFVDRMFGVMASAGAHRYMTLTKRADRLRRYIESRAKSVACWEEGARSVGHTLRFEGPNGRQYGLCPFPVPWVLLGFSAENQACFEARWAEMQPVAAMGWKVWVSLEPLLCSVDIRPALEQGKPRLSGVVIGGESGPSARPFDIHWAKTIIEHCHAAGVPCYLKQLGSAPMYRSHGDDSPSHLFNGLQRLYSNGCPLKSRKGEDTLEWPAGLRVRESFA